MNQLIRRLTFISFTIFLFELVVIGILGAFWAMNLFGFQEVQNIALYLFAGVGFFLLVDVLFFWFSLGYLNKRRQRNDIDAASLIGSDIQEAYRFGALALAVTDDKEQIIWANDVFEGRQLAVIDSKITDLHPQVKSLVEDPSQKSAKAEIKGRWYEVRYLPSSHLFIFHDVTDFENIFAYSKNQATVLGIIMLDNYNDIGSDTDESADLVTKVRVIITDYCRDYGVLLRRVKNDTYFAVCNHASLEKIQEDRFSLLDKVRNAAGVGETPITLSIGFAHNFPDIAKLNEMATQALNVALSRGGDQAVVSAHGEDLRFYGGKTAAVETTNRVKVRSLVGSVISLIKSSTDVFIMGHNDMDMDALGSCLGVKAIAEWCQKPAKVVYNPRQVEKKTRMAFQNSFDRATAEEITISPEEAYSKMGPGSLLIVCDISVPELVLAPKLLDKASKVIVIDHHRRGEKFIDHPILDYIEPSASSASEMVAEMIRYAKANPRIELKSNYATIMMSGIFLDSMFFKSKSTGMRTFEAAEILKGYGADNSLADDFLKDEFEEYSLVNRIIASMKTPYSGIVYCSAGDRLLVDRAVLSKVANQLMQIKGINACFVIGCTDNDVVRISSRSDGTVNMQLLCEKMNGGGHFTAAASQFKNATCDKVIEILLAVLNDYLDAARSGTNTEVN